jgi:hypothetical protein
MAETLGRPLMPHQRHITNVAMEIDESTGRLAYSTVVLIGPRQATGKTELLLGVMSHRCVGFEHDGPQRVMYTAQTADDARKKWRDVHVPRLEATALRSKFRTRLTLNQEAMIWGNGSMWYPGSTTGKTGGTGDTLDLGVIDEAWSRPNARTELGMKPAMMTRWRWRQLWVTSMIPGLSRSAPGTWSYLENLRTVGRARVAAGTRTGMAFFDYAAPEDADPYDPATWYAAMPGLGITVDESAIREDFELATDPVDLFAEYLGWAPLVTRPKWTLVREATWERLRDPLSSIEGPCALSVEMSEDRTRAWVGIAGHRFDGHWHVALAEPGWMVAPGVVGVDWVERRVAELVREAKPATVVIDARRPSTSLIVSLRNAGIDVLTPNQNEIAGACGRFYDATGQDAPEDDVGTRLRHLGQADLDRAMAGARKLEMPGGSFTFVRKGASAVLGPLYAVVLAMLGVDAKASEIWPEPAIYG